MPIDLTLLYTRPTTRRTSRPDRVDLFLPSHEGEDGGSYVVANYIRADHANAIIDAVQQHGIILDLLRDLVDDVLHDPQIHMLSADSLAAARAYLSTRRP